MEAAVSPVNAGYSKLKRFLELGSGPEDEDNGYAGVLLSNLGKTDVLQWFRQVTESDAAWVLHRLAEIKPHIVSEALAAKCPTMAQFPGITQTQDESPKSQAITQKGGVGGERGGKHVKRSSTHMSDLSGLPIIEFASDCTWAEEGVDNMFMVDVIRIGNQNMTSEVSYKTEDGSAVSGRQYTATAGRLVFKPGVTTSQIKIPILNDPQWNTTLDFTCILTEESLHQARLGQYLHKTKVTIIDRNCFPSDSYRHCQTEADIKAMPRWTLLFEVFRCLCTVPNVWKGTIKFVAVDICHSIWSVLSLYMNVYMLDYILDTASPSSVLLLIQDRRLSLLGCSLLSMAAVALLHALDYLRITFPVKGPMKAFLQSSLLRKFLNYKRIVHERLRPGDLIHGIQHDTFDLIEFGYINFLKLLKAVCELFFLLGFKVTYPLLIGVSYDVKAFAILFSTPVFLAVFVVCRQRTTMGALRTKNDQHNEVTNEIQMLTAGYHLVIDYNLRDHFERRFQEKRRRYTLAIQQADQVLMNDVYFCTWCTSLSTAAYVLYGGLQVINGSLSVGLFVTNIRLFKSAGRGFLTIYTLTIGMMQTFPGLVNITTVMNYPTDQKQRAHINRHQQAEATASRERMLQKRWGDADEIPIDTMAIVLNSNCPFKYEGHETALNLRGHVSFDQGQLVAVIGRLGCGKATLLHLIACSVLPEEGRESPIFIPPHLRVANVADEPIFFSGSLYDNLTLGMDTSQQGASRERVKSICKRLTKSDIITDYMERNEEAPWFDLFSKSQCKLLSIARALVHNVEVLTIHKPLARLSHEDCVHLTEAFHAHIADKGLDLIADKAHRRPRTIIISAVRASDKAVREASQVILVDPIHGVRSLETILETGSEPDRGDLGITLSKR